MELRVPTWPSGAAATAALGGGLLALGAPAAASPSELGGPDLECFDTPGAPLALELRLSHLDPVLVQLGLTGHGVVVRELVETCVAVARRGMPRPAAPAVPPVDLACYRIDAAALPAPVPLAVAHATPALALLPGHDAQLTRPAELCLPVAPDGVALAPDVRRLVQAIALECYATEPGPHPAFGLGVTALDPELARDADRELAIGAGPRRLCLPVAKNSERIPPDVRGVLRRIGVEQLAVSRPTAAPASPGSRVVLHHLNPLLATLPAVAVVLHQVTGVMLPVTRRAPAP